jgi:hypothetical protein
MEPTHKNCKQHRINKNVEQKHCNSCKTWKPLTEFNKASTWDKLDRKMQRML